MNIPLFCYKEKGKLFLFLYFCSRREFLGGNTPHITELATVAKSLPHSLRKAYK